MKIRDIAWNYILITLIIGVLTLSFYVSTGAMAYWGFSDAVDATVNAIKGNLIDPFKQTAQTKFMSAFSNIGIFTSRADIKLAIIGVLLGLVTQGDYGEKFLAVYSGMFLFLRFFTLNWTAAEWGAINIALSLDLIPMVDINLWPLIIQFLLFRQMFFALTGYFVGAFTASMSNYGESASWIQWVTRISTMIMLGYTIIDPIIHPGAL